MTLQSESLIIPTTPVRGLNAAKGTEVTRHRQC